jgi:hypothetical protein
MVLIPVWMAGLMFARRGKVEGDRPSRVEFAAALLPPLVTVCMVGPMIWRIVREFDVPHHLATSEVRSLGVLAATFAPLRVLDLVNDMVVYVPLFPLAAYLALTSRGAFEDSDRKLAVLLALSTVPLLLLVHPMQGIFRDLDVFALPGIAFAIVTAHVVGTELQRDRLPRWLGPGILAACLVPAVQWMLHFHDPVRGLRRVQAFAVEAPARPAGELAPLWDFIAYRAFRLREWSVAVEASEQSVRHAPHERALIMLAIARTYAGDHRGAQAIYMDLTERYPNEPVIWLGLCGESVRLRDSVQTARAIARLETYAPGSREARAIRTHLKYFPEVWPAPGEVPLHSRR